MAYVHKVIGMMSGTSLDGIDAALLETDGECVVRAGPAVTVSYPPELRAGLRAALAAAAGLAADGQPAIRDVERSVTEAHANLVKRLLTEAGLSPREVSLIGFHGQTILHRPRERRTRQIGDGALLAKLTGIDVINDFRVADIAAGGEGAPFVPLYHAALVRGTADLELPVVVVNIGGVSNVTYIDRDTILAFDAGPGNAPLDDWAERHTGKPIDKDGKLAGEGHVNDILLAKLLNNAFFTKRPPKSLDRMDFPCGAVDALSPADGAATLTAFTAAAIARSAEHFPKAAKVWIVCGGGRHNPVVMRNLRDRVGTFVQSAEDAGWRGDFIEAEAFGYLAVRSQRGLPLSLPTTTGVPRPMTGGRLHRWAA